MLVFQHALFGPARSTPLLAPNLLRLLLSLAPLALALLQQFLAQLAAGQVSIHGLRPLALALHLHPAGHMPQPNTGRGLVNLLPPLARPLDESLLKITLLQAEFRHASQQLVSLA